MTSIEIKNTRLNVSVSAETETVKRSAADLLAHLDSFLSLVEDGAFEGDPISRRFTPAVMRFPPRLRLSTLAPAKPPKRSKDMRTSSAPRSTPCARPVRRSALPVTARPA